MTTYVILTSKPGQFRTEPSDGLVPVEAWDYHCDGRVRARFLVAELPAPTRVRVIDESGQDTVNSVPSKFLESFADLESARRELRNLCSYGSTQAELRPRDPAAFNTP
ncbi:ferredoxin [Hydrogenophaga sp. YM1]|jgi:hypothetical protein|uniref:Ferredoxin n=2 Tax=Hydrogenophaga TaxID=47420 RepID=A0A372EG69_9BURK|nr:MULTISPECIES: hypothetical protein [Hydrogenophaga]NCT97507.1 ferredoxin [Comamonadaceae bacterium]ODT34681.1 MAG: hypothetical protein ABS53_00315 [Hydrogenophaga sp. SCN 70-13]MBN9370674.1 ferredoxin [Hydrogenophaga sp.]QRR33901.1 ferredoxin [Hydrogenophaga sp. YM1]RFP77429.1 ferredoxin [Hydrogenophaga borbori]